MYTVRVSCARYEHSCVTVCERKGGDYEETNKGRVCVPKYMCIKCVCVCVSVPPPPAEPTHVSSVVRASAALPSPWMDSMAVE